MVSNTGPLSRVREAAARLRLYPAAVRHDDHFGVLQEVAEGQFVTPPAYLQPYGSVNLIAVQGVSRREPLPEAARLHLGEAQASQLARELALPLLIEETVGRRVAQGLGIPISGIAGQIITAFHRGIITAQDARTKLLELFQAGRINRKIYAALLAVIRCAEQGHAGAGVQRPLRFSFQPRLMPSVRLLMLNGEP
jgi:predicted nucleic acid-binding protein